MSEACSICGLTMLRPGVRYEAGELVTCGRGHLARVAFASAQASVGTAEVASEWVRRIAGPVAHRLLEVAPLVESVRNLETLVASLAEERDELETRLQTAEAYVELRSDDWGPGADALSEMLRGTR